MNPDASSVECSNFLMGKAPSVIVAAGESRAAMWKGSSLDALGLFALLAVVLVAGVEVLAIVGVFWSRIHFGDRFDPVVFSEFETVRSTDSVNKTFGLKEAEAARRMARVVPRDQVTLAMERAGQELDQTRSRSAEADLLHDEAERDAVKLLAEAEAALAAAHRESAKELLQRALQKAPWHLPSVRCLGNLLEQEKNPGQARFYWEKLASMVPAQGAEQAEIQSNLNRLAGVETEIKKIPPSSGGIAGPEPVAVSATASAGNSISLVAVRRQELPLQDLYDLRFNLQIVLGSAGTESSMDIAETKVEVVFFDQVRSAEGVTQPTKVLAFPLQPKAAWPTGAEQTLSLNYSVPYGYFRRRSASSGGSCLFCGYVVRVFYRGKFQAAQAQPPEILEKYVHAP